MSRMYERFAQRNSHRTHSDAPSLTTYVITNTRSGASLGTYLAASPEAALDMMASDCGYDDYSDLWFSVPTPYGEIVVTPVAGV
jgi:hypothetical protein